jgi:hypothetical protein
MIHYSITSSKKEIQLNYRITEMTNGNYHSMTLTFDC